MKRNTWYAAVMAVMATAAPAMAGEAIRLQAVPVAEVRYLSGVDLRLNDSVRAGVVFTRIQQGMPLEVSGRRKLTRPPAELTFTFRF